MLSSQTITIGTALLIAFGLVCFGIRRLINHFREEFRKDNSLKATPYTVDSTEKGQATKI
jgi:hypothetical protein